MGSTLTLAQRLATVGELRLRNLQGDALPDPRSQSSGIARSLTQVGLRRGDRVAVVLPNGPEFVSVLLACLELETVFVPMNPALTDAEVSRRCKLAGVSARWDSRRGLSRAEGERGVLSDAPFVPAVILFTSGSAGEGRPVALSEGTLRHVVDSHHLALGYGTGESIVGCLPWSHAFGFALELMMGLLHGAVLQSVAAPLFAEVFLHSSAHYLFAVPRMIERLPQDSLPRLRGGIVGGAPIRGDLRRRLQETRLRVGYGQTECGPGVTLGEPGEFEVDDFLGRPVGCDVVLRPATGEGAGELLVRGPNLAWGHVQGAELIPLALEDSWWSTGDLAQQVGDGFAFQGRQDDLFKLDNGRMVNPVPLELLYGGRILLVGAGRDAVQPLARGEVPTDFTLPIPHLQPALMAESFWIACTTVTGKVSRRRAESLFYRT